MGITDIIRGEDHISNTPRQILLARSLGFRIPQYTHLPLIFGSDGTPLSKRHGATSLQAYRARGYCAEGILNYLALLGWGPPGDKEFFKLNDLIHAFSLKRVNKTNAVFDEQKLNHINALYFKNMGMDDYCSQGTSYFTHQHTSQSTYDRANLGGLLKIYKDRIASFSDLVDKADYFFQDTVSFDNEAVSKYFTNDQIPHYLADLIQKLQQCESFNDVSELEETVRSLAHTLGIKAAQLIHPIRVALTGKGTSPGIFDVMSVLGKKRSLQRLQHCVDNFEAIVKQSS